MIQPIVSDIKRFAVHDGDGIRTTVFLKGCPLRCVWCHNPEGLWPHKQIAYFAHKCVYCGACAAVCPQGAHNMAEGTHTFRREVCVNCGVCAEHCLGDALKLYGTAYTTEELLSILTEDREFYENSGGGVTLSGGECLLYADFCAELLKKLKAQGIHTAVDTCGCVHQKAFDTVMPYTDIFLYDIKAIDDQVHKACTGQSNKQILANFAYLARKNKKTEVRIPYVPSYNDGEIYKIFDYLKQFSNITKIRVLAYHNYAGSKYNALGLKNTLPQNTPPQEEIARLQSVADGIVHKK